MQVSPSASRSFQGERLKKGNFITLQEKETGRDSTEAATKVGRSMRRKIAGWLTFMPGKNAWRWVPTHSVTGNAIVGAPATRWGGLCQTIGSAQSGRHCFPRCVCRPGWEGEDCSQPVCAPQCMNGGSCSAPGAALDQAHVHKDHQNRSEPHAHARTHLQRGDSSLISGVCDCPAGFQGRSCEGGICSLPCQHGGQCIQRDTCRCLTGNREVPN